MNSVSVRRGEASITYDFKDRHLQNFKQADSQSGHDCSWQPPYLRMQFFSHRQRFSFLNGRPLNVLGIQGSLISGSNADSGLVLPSDHGLAGLTSLQALVCCLHRPSTLACFCSWSSDVCRGYHIPGFPLRHLIFSAQKIHLRNISSF